MRILHTSDWHLGRALEGRPRIAEQEAFLEEIVEIAKSEAVDLVLVAGDVFDTYNPSSEAERLFYGAVEALAGQGERGVVVVAGNHDSPDRIRAANPLALEHGICLVGYPGEELPTGTSSGRVARLCAGPGWLELAFEGYPETAVVFSLGYPCESRMNRVLSEDLEEGSQHEGYSHQVGDLLREAHRAFREDTVNLLMAHVFVSGGWQSDSERPVQMGGAPALEPRVLPSSAHYIALGHLHRPQPVKAPAPCRYSGSPLAYSFSESDQQKEVVVVEALPGREARVKPVQLSSGRFLKKWRAASLEEVRSWCSETRNLNCWVDLELALARPITSQELGELRGMHPGIVSIRVLLPDVEVEKASRLSEMSLSDQFKAFALRQLGAEPSQQMVDLFLELTNEEDLPSSCVSEEGSDA